MPRADFTFKTGCYFKATLIWALIFCQSLFRDCNFFGLYLCISCIITSYFWSSTSDVTSPVNHYSPWARKSVQNVWSLKTAFCRIMHLFAPDLLFSLLCCGQRELQFKKYCTRTFCHHAFVSFRPGIFFLLTKENLRQTFSSFHCDMRTSGAWKETKYSFLIERKFYLRAPMRWAYISVCALQKAFIRLK